MTILERKVIETVESESELWKNGHFVAPGIFDVDGWRIANRELPIGRVNSEEEKAVSASKGDMAIVVGRSRMSQIRPNRTVTVTVLYIEQLVEGV
jgi:hypothetical protein